MKKSFSLNLVLQIFVTRKLGERDISVDALRGLAIIGMILVNHAPPTAEVYGFLVHSPWDGWTIADTIFPIFLFLVGVSISYSAAQHARIFRRSVLLICINIALVNFPYYEFDTLVVHGTLSRIALCYLVASLISSHCGWKTQIGVVAGILALQWWFLMQFHVPGFGNGVIAIEGNASDYLDRLIFGDFVTRLLLNSPVIQGLLPSAGAIASTLIGVLTGNLVRLRLEMGDRPTVLFAVGLILVFAGSAWGVAYPVNKQLWTGSYVLLMSGLSMQLLALFDWLLNFRQFRVPGKLLQIAGVNALFFYVLAQVFQRILVYGHVVYSDGTVIRYRYLIYENWFEPWVDGKAGALIYTSIFLGICYLFVALLYRWRIFVKL